VPLYNDCHEVIGTGWKAVAVMWDGARSLGWVTTDNLFSRQILSSYQLELLSLYATTLGHLAVVRKREEALAAERNLFRTVIDAVPDYIYVKDLEHRFLLVNKASWEDTPGFSGESDFIGKTDFDILPHDYAKRYREDEQHIIASGQPMVNAEEPGRSRDGLSKTLLTTKVPLCGLDGRVIGLAGVSRDITDRKRIERQALELAVERERINALRQSITSISHDLRTPLFAISASLYLLEHVADPEKQKGQLETIKQQTAVLERFVKEIELSSQLETASEVSRSQVNLNRLAARVVQTLSRLAEKKKLALITRLQPGLLDVSGNETELEQVLENLIRNAIIYTNEGGRIELSTAHESDRVVVEIADTGIELTRTICPIFSIIFSGWIGPERWARPVWVWVWRLPNESSPCMAELSKSIAQLGRAPHFASHYRPTTRAGMTCRP
jgi:PAS domain S-box-containing protein